jgi:PBP1b-binding outer membrane lipoprotein LpoB
MKTKIVLTALLLAIILTSCVQKTHKKTVIFTIDVSEIRNIKKVGIRGNDKPLSWDYVTEMKALKKDSVYEITSTFETGYQFTEVKFVVNDNIELQDEDNRRVVFSEKDTTYFNAKFNKRN